MKQIIGRKILQDLYSMRVTKDTLVRRVSFIKKRHPNAKVIIYGDYAHRYMWESLFYSDADFVCIGDDDEATIEELKEKWGQDLYYSGITGLGYKRQGPWGQEIWLGNKREVKK